MFVEILDIKAGKSFRVKGTQVFGRMNSNADVSVPDRTVSSKHARIFPKDGCWYLEDLRSSNGTFIKGTRISEPVVLEEGLRFSLCRYSYEVVHVATVEDKDSDVGEDLDLINAPTAVTTGALPFGNVDVDAAGDAEGSGPSEVSQPTVEKNRTLPPKRQLEITDDRPGKSLGRVKQGTIPPIANEPLLRYFLRALPGIAAYYLTLSPKLLVNPAGVVKSSIQQQTFEAMEPRELAAYALPPGILTVLLASLGGIFVALFSKTFSAGLLISPLIGLGITIVVAVIVGFIFHPILEWVINALKGHSDDRSRSNFFVITQAAIPLTAVATLTATLLLLVPLPFIAILGPLIGIATTLIAFSILYSWVIYFEVHRAVPVVVVVLAVAACFGSVRATVGIIRADIARVSDGATSHTTHKSASKTGTDSAEDAGTTAADTSTTYQAPSKSNVSARAKTSRYPAFAAKRDAIQEAIKRDPVLLDTRGVLKLYRQYLEAAGAARAKHAAKTEKMSPSEAEAENIIANHKADAAVFRSSGEIIDKLYGKLFD